MPGSLQMTAGEWLADRWYVADVAGGQVILLPLTLAETPAEVERRGQAIRESRRRQQVLRRRRQRKLDTNRETDHY